jgi:hypothetical protein
VSSFKIKGDTKGVEFYISDGKFMYSQVKSVCSVDDYSKINILKLKQELKMLNDTSKKLKVERLFYLPIPFDNTGIKLSFIGKT